jgi:hypothetical protein
MDGRARQSLPLRNGCLIITIDCDVYFLLLFVQRVHGVLV